MRCGFRWSRVPGRAPGSTSGPGQPDPGGGCWSGRGPGPGARSRVGHVPAPLLRPPAGTGLLATGRATGIAPGQAWLVPGSRPRDRGPGPRGWRPAPGPGADQWLQAGPGPLRAPRDQDRGPEMPDDPGAPPPSPQDRRSGSEGHRFEPHGARVPGTGGTGAARRSRDGSYRNQARLPAGQHGSYQGTRQGTRQGTWHRSPHRKAGAPRPAGALPVAPWTWRLPLVVRQENHDLAVSPVDLASAGTLGASGQLTLRSDPPSWSAWQAGPRSVSRDGPRGGPRATSWFGSRGQAGPPGRSSGRSPD